MFSIKEKPIFTIKLITLFLISTILIRTIGILFETEISNYLVLYPSNVSQPLNWYKFLTYPLDSIGLIGWFKIALIILPAGYIIEKRTAKKNLITITLISIVLGGLILQLLI